MGFGIRDDLDLNPGTFHETVGKSLHFSESAFSSIKCGDNIYLLQESSEGMNEWEALCTVPGTGDGLCDGNWRSYSRSCSRLKAAF